MGEMLRQAVFMEDVVTFEHLVKQRANLEARDELGSTPLTVAANQKKLSSLTWLLARRADVHAVDQQAFTALSWACVKGHKETVTALLAAKASLEVEDETSLAQRGIEKEEARLMLERCACKSPLSLSAERGHMDCVQELLSRGARLEQPNRDQSTAMMCAAHHCETLVVNMLLGLKSMVNTVDAEGWTALMYAANAPVPPTGSGGEETDQRVAIDGVFGKRTLTELLLLHGADVNAQSQDGLTALIIAAGQNRPLACRRLLEAQAQVNAATARGQTALLMAVANDAPEVVRALLLAAADVNQANVRKDTPLAIAEKYSHREVTSLLKQAGAAPPKGGKKKKGKGKK
jgi:ankyrin repeat protein